MAAVLMIMASVTYIAASTRWFAEPGFLPEQMGGGPIWAPLGVIVMLPFAVPLLGGGVLAMVRRSWGLAFVGAMLPLVLTLFLLPWGWTRVGPEYIVRSFPTSARYFFVAAVYLAILVATVLLYISRREFRGRRSSAEHLFAPPRHLIAPED